MRQPEIRGLLALLLGFTLTACTHSHVIKVTVTNTSAEKISTIVIDYPEATFGINSLGPGQRFEYKIKPTATGALKIEFLNAQGRDVVSKGPEIHKGDEGSIGIKLTQEGASSAVKLN